MGRTARGVKGIKLKKGQKLISLNVADPSKTILCVSENGYGKKTNLDDFPTHNRGGQGVISIKTSDRNGLMVAATLVEDNDGIMLNDSNVKFTIVNLPLCDLPITQLNKFSIIIKHEFLIFCMPTQ